MDTSAQQELNQDPPVSFALSPPTQVIRRTHGLFLVFFLITAVVLILVSLTCYLAVYNPKKLPFTVPASLSQKLAVFFTHPIFHLPKTPFQVLWLSRENIENIDSFDQKFYMLVHQGEDQIIAVRSDGSVQIEPFQIDQNLSAVVSSLGDYPEGQLQGELKIVADQVYGELRYLSPELTENLGAAGVINEWYASRAPSFDLKSVIAGVSEILQTQALLDPDLVAVGDRIDGQSYFKLVLKPTAGRSFKSVLGPSADYIDKVQIVLWIEKESYELRRVTVEAALVALNLADIALGYDKIPLSQLSNQPITLAFGLELENINQPFSITVPESSAPLGSLQEDLDTSRAIEILSRAIIAVEDFHIENGEYPAEFDRIAEYDQIVSDSIRYGVMVEYLKQDGAGPTLIVWIGELVAESPSIYVYNFEQVSSDIINFEEYVDLKAQTSQGQENGQVQEVD